MSNLDAAIRAALDRQHDVMVLDDMFVSDITGGWQSALLAVLDIHKRNGPNCCTECWESGPGYEGEPVPYPCPTVQAIANRLEIET